MKNATALNKCISTFRYITLLILAGMASNSFAACVAGFTYSINHSTKTVTFTNTSTGPGTKSYYWNFNDGSQTVYTQNPVHTFLNPGLHVVTLYVSSTDTPCSASRTDTLLITGTATCEAKFNYSVDSNQSPLVYKFDGWTSTGANLVYTWNWDDGSLVTHQPLEWHVFKTPGNHHVCLNVYNRFDTTCIHTKCVDVYTDSIEPCSPPDFSFTINHSNRIVSFTNLTQGTGMQFSWDFNDGNFSSARHPTHTFLNPGYHYVCLSAYSILDTSCNGKKCDTLFIQGTATCQAQLNIYKDPNSASYQVYTNGLGSTGANLIYIWNFGDGTTDTTLTYSSSHSYQLPGIYMICLTVVNALDPSCRSTRCDSVVFLRASCNAQFYHFADSNMGATKFNPFYGVQGTAYLWDFGDGQTSSQKDPWHTYANPGWYWVCLTISNTADSCADTFCDSVLVSTTQAIEEAAAIPSTGELFPNPANDKVYLRIHATKAETVKVIVYNLIGEAELTLDIPLHVGTQTLEANIQELKPGIHFIELNFSTGRSMKRLVK